MKEFFGNEEEISATTELLESGTLLLILESARKAILKFVAWLARIITVLEKPTGSTALIDMNGPDEQQTPRSETNDNSSTTDSTE